MTPHLRGNVRAYVDRSLPAPMLHAFDRHVVCCVVCRAAADQERRIVAALRSDTDVPHNLRSALLGLAGGPAGLSGPEDGRDPDVPAPPVGFRMPPSLGRQPVPTVAPTAPPLHRSPLRAAVVASLAAGASVAAAWSLAVMPQPAPAPSRGPAPLLPGVASFGYPTLSPTRLGTATATLPVGLLPQTAGKPWMPRFDAAVQAVEQESVRIGMASSAQSRP